MTGNRFGAVAARSVDPRPPVPAVGEELRKYTIKLTPALADLSDGDVLTIRRRLGRKVDKSEVVRALLTQLHDDPTLLDTVVDSLRT